jgi:16S rRNA G966 N2-methylase RsmD
MISYSLNDGIKDYKQKYQTHYSMDELSKKLNIAKSEIDKPKKENPKGSQFDFSFVTTFFEMSKMLKQKVSRDFNIPKISNAYLKQYEILCQFPEIIKLSSGKLKTPIYRYFDNASFPGAFIRGTDHYIKDHIPEIKYFDWFASSLFNEEYGVLGDEYNLLYNYPFRWLMDLPSKKSEQKNNGDVSNPDNIIDFRNKFQSLGLVPLYTSDLGFDVSSDYSKQEIFHLRPNLGQICCSLFTLEQGGTQITKQFTFFELRNKIILYLLTKMYKKVSIIKPITSKPDNSEVYILCIGYNRKDSLANRELILNSLKEWDKPILEEIRLPEEFNNKLTFIANELYQRQIEKIRFNIDLFNRLKREKRGNDNRVNLPKDIYVGLQREVDTWLKVNPIKYLNDPIPIEKTITSDRTSNNRNNVVLDISEWHNISKLSLMDYYNSLFTDTDQTIIDTVNKINTIHYIKPIFRIELLRGKTIVYNKENRDIAEMLLKLLLECGGLLRSVIILKPEKYKIEQVKWPTEEVKKESENNLNLNIKDIENELSHFKGKYIIYLDIEGKNYSNVMKILAYLNFPPQSGFTLDKYEKHEGETNYYQYNGIDIPFEPNHFDLVTIFTQVNNFNEKIFHSLRIVMKPNSILIVRAYDQWNNILSKFGFKNVSSNKNYLFFKLHKDKTEEEGENLLYTYRQTLGLEYTSQHMISWKENAVNSYKNYIKDIFQSEFKKKNKMNESDVKYVLQILSNDSPHPEIYYQQLLNNVDIPRTVIHINENKGDVGDFVVLTKEEVKKESEKIKKESEKVEKKPEKKSWADISDEETEEIQGKIEWEYNHWKFIKTVFVTFTEKQMVKSSSTNIDKRKYEMINCLERFLISVYNNPDNNKINIDKLAEELVSKNIISKQYIEFYKKEINTVIDNIKGKIPPKKIEFTKIYPPSLGNNTISYKDFSYDLNTLETDRVKFLFNQGNENVLLMLLRYDSCLSAGQQWSCPQSFFDDIYNNYNIRYEGFASPLNSRLMLKEGTKFCSLFPDVDAIFGSIGDFFKTTENKNWLVNPPFVESILERASLKSIELSKGSDKNSEIVVIFVMPNWTDSKAYKNLNESKQMVYKEYLQANTYNYQKGKELIRANFPSMIFVLSNKKGNYSDITKNWRIKKSENKTTGGQPIQKNKNDFINQFESLSVKNKEEKSKEVFNFNTKVLFPHTGDFKKLRMTNIGLYSITPYIEANNITQLIVKNFDIYFEHQIWITDATANVGGNSISFWLSKTFSVRSVEIDPLTCDILRNNLKVYNLPTDYVVCNDYTKIYKERRNKEGKEARYAREDIVFLDPPWGGSNYKSKVNLDLFLGDMNIIDICYDLFENELVDMGIVLKLPLNYNLEGLKERMEETKLYKDNNMKIITNEIYRKGVLTFNLVSIIKMNL